MMHIQRMSRSALAVVGVVTTTIVISTLLITDSSSSIRTSSSSWSSLATERFLQLPFLPNNCPPEGFDARSEFDVDEYIRALWYPQKAAPVIYALGPSYCSVVKYTRNNENSDVWWRPTRPRIDVRNRGLAGSIDGSLNEANIKAFVPNPDEYPGRIKVGGLQGYLSVWLQSSNYWVVAAGTYDSAVSYYDVADNNDTTYEWALISGGPPRRETENGKCIAGSASGFSSLGLWIFTRDPFPPEGVVENITAYADEEMGLETNTLLSNTHEGCTYDFLDDDELPN